ncbi:MAG: histidine kinase [Methanobacterium paludis]|nr:histidine kinase [Methanobacterium paludis]
MNDLAMIIKGLLFGALAIKYIQGNVSHLYLILILVLLSMFLNIIIYIYEKKNFKRIILAALIILNVYYSIHINIYFMIFVPMNMYELIFTYTDRLIFYIISPIIILFFIANGMAADYLIIASLTLAAYYSAIKGFERIHKFELKCDELREKNHLLIEKIERINRYDTQIAYTSQLEERNKISQQIHDKVGHTIAGSLMQLEAAKLIVTKDSNKAENILENVIKILRDGLEEIRITLRAMKPKQEQLGINKIKLIIKRFEIETLKINFNCSGDMDKINIFMWDVIEKNVMEALTNVSKYSLCTEVNINIEVLNKVLKVQVKDNGIGCEVLKKGLGILGMEERMNKVNGQILVDGSDGFRIIMLFPI